MDKGESVSPWVSRCLDIIDKSGLDYRLNPMGTVVEGEWDEAFAVVKQCFDAMREDCKRIIVNLKVDYREGRQGALTSKITAVEKGVGKTLKK